MKRMTSFALGLIALSLVAGVAPAQIPGPVDRRIVRPGDRFLPGGGVLPRIQIIDPAAHRLDVQILSWDRGRFEGRIRITGVVKNVGTRGFVSGANQQSVTLYRDARAVARRTFRNLAPGEEVTVSFDTDWYTPNEFPPTFKLEIGYDPDIFLDGNPNNDDGRMGNNRVELTGYQVHDRIRAMVR